MAISVSFNGATIYRPGAYSQTTIDLGGNLPLGPAGLIAIFGEADAGTPGASEVDISQNFYTATTLSQAAKKYRSGPVADALNFLFAPATDGAIPSGAQTVWVYKTNASTQASLTLASSYGTIKALEWGVGGNQISYKNTVVGSGQVSVTGTPPAYGAALDAASFSYRYNGGAAQVVTLGTGSHATLSALVTELNGIPAFSAHLVASAPGTSLIITTIANVGLAASGAGESLELVDSTPTNLAKLGLVAGMNSSLAEPVASLQLKGYRDNLIESTSAGGHVVMTVGRSTTGSPSSATVTIDATNITLTDSAATVTLALNAYITIGQLAAAISLQPNWTAAITNSVYAQMPIAVLDEVSGVGALATVAGGMPARIKKDAYEVQAYFGASTQASLDSPAALGLPAAATEVLLAGGSKGGTTSASVVAALAAFQKIYVNSVVPLISRDATADIADSLTDATSTYTVAGTHQSLKTHISLMVTTKNRLERQGYASIKDTYANCKTAAGTMADARVQMAIQDIRQTNATGSILWYQPWALACLLAGARGGAPIGLPLTNKYLNASGIRQTGQSMNTAAGSIVIDFDPSTQYDDAIQAGITFLDAPSTGGFRVVVDNTTYGVDDNWVYNRGNVLYAADIVAYNFRNAMERRYVGVKNNIKAAEVSGTADSILRTFLAQGITVSTSDAPAGYKNLTVQIIGNTIEISVTIKLIEGIDFVLSKITLQRASQTA